MERFYWQNITILLKMLHAHPLYMMRGCGGRVYTARQNVCTTFVPRVCLPYKAELKATGE